MKLILQIITVISIFIITFIAIIGIEILIARSRGKTFPFTNPEHTERIFGQGDKLVYVVLGDSTSAGQGGDYEKGIAVSTATFLGKKNEVHMTNFSISGAIVRDVLEKQLSDALILKPDVVLLSVGSNDVTHRTNLKSLKKELTEIVSKIHEVNKDTKIILTGSGDVASSPRFLEPLKSILGIQIERINSVFDEVIKNDSSLLLAPVVETGKEFRKNPDLFSEDKYHPNTEGYLLWVEVINKELERTN
jgi:lysophospholipase L1-like esterase